MATKGVAVALDGEPMTGPDMLRQLNTRFGQYGVGRHIYTGDVSIGLKGRIVFECPGIDALLLAHQALEDCVNTRLQNQFRHFVAQRWAELVYTGFFYEPHKNDLEAYLASSQSAVTGLVTMMTEGGSVLASEVHSDYILQDAASVYAQSCDWLGPDVWFAHSVYVDENEIGLYANHGCGVAHCPSSNMRLASGAAPILDMVAAGVDVGLGVDGSASNDGSQ